MVFAAGVWKSEDIEKILCNHGLIIGRRQGSDPDQFIFKFDILYLLYKNKYTSVNYIVELALFTFFDNFVILLVCWLRALTNAQNYCSLLHHL